MMFTKILIYKDIEARFDNSNFEIDRRLPKGHNKKVIGLMKDELDGQIMKELVVFKAKTYSYLKDNNAEDKNCLEAAQSESKINYLRKKKIDVDSLKEDLNDFVKN